MAGGLLLQGEIASAAPTVTAPATRLTEAQAVEVARAFCRKIGQAVTVPGTATFAADAQAPPSHYWQPVWNVAFPAQAEVEVVDATNVIADYWNSAYSITHRDNSPPGEAIPQSEAIQRAQDVINATQQIEPLQFRGAEIFQFHTPPLARACVWSVDWSRVSRGIPYYDQHVGVMLDAQTGEIKGLILNLTTPPLKSAIQAVSQLDAINIGAAEVIRQGIEEGATHKETHLEIITPNNRWPHSSDKPGQHNGIRLAWAVTFIVDGHWREVKIDAETGEILDEGWDNGPAGRQAATASAAMPTVPAVAPMLSSLRAVYVRGRDASGKWAAKPLLKFGAKDQPQAVALLAKTTDFRKEGPSGAAPQQVVLVSKSNILGVYSYFPEAGLLGSGSDWAVVPGEFKAWIQRKIAATPPASAEGAKK